MIASGELGPGAKFPPEPELCDHLGVSRSSLREATRSLAALGVIESRHGSGTYVSALDPAEIISRFSLSVELIPLEGVLQLLEVRRILEAHATAAAAARQDPALAEQLADILDRLESDRPTPPRSRLWTPSSTARSARPAGTRRSPR